MPGTADRSSARNGMTPAEARALTAARRVWIVGTPGCGKSTLSAALTRRTGAPWVQLDEHFWGGPGGRPRPEEEFLARTEAALAPDRWVVDGQYPAAVTAFAGRAECVVWVDPPTTTAFLRLLRRTVRRWIRREVLWGGERETFWTVVGPHSILWYALRQRKAQLRANEELFERLAGSGAVLIRTRRTDVSSLLGTGGS